jgi:ABC-type phosphate transport system auxiliary subunit
MNAIDSLCGSTDLISIRSKGSVKRDFVKVNDIEAQAAKETLDQEQRINSDIEGFRAELSKIISSDQQDDIIGSEIIAKKAELEEKLYKAQMQLREVKNQKRQNIEKLKTQLRNFNTLPGPIIILVIAFIVTIRRSARKRHYISHSSDA